MKKWRVAVIGRTGKGNYGHGLDVVWKRLDNVEVIAVADEHEKGREAAMKRIGVERGYADYRKMLEKEKPQIVAVAPRHLDTHRDMVVACARAGASMFLEKPMCRDLAEADEMVKACEMHHVKLAIAHQTRYSPVIARVQDLIKEGKLGRILEIRARGKEDRRGGGEDLMVLGTHLMDLKRLFAGDCRWCHAKIYQNEKPATKADVHPGGEAMGSILGDHINATYGFDHGIQSTFGTHRAKEGAGKRFGMQIFGTKGIVQLTTGSVPDAFFLDDPSWFPGRSRAQWQRITSNGLGKEETLKDRSLVQGNEWVAKDLIESIEKDRQPRGSVYDARGALEMILAVYESHRLGKPVDMPLKNRVHPLKLYAAK